MKLLLVADLLLRNHDGCNRTVFQLIDRLEKDKDIDLTIIVGKHKGLNKDIRQYKVPTLTLPFNKDYLIALPMLSYSLDEILDEVNPDVIHITSPTFLGSQVSKEARKRNIPCLTIFHTNFLAYIPYYVPNPNFITGPLIDKIHSGYTDFYNRFDKILVPTHTMTKHLSSVNVDIRKCHILGRGIDRTIFKRITLQENPIHKYFTNQKKNILFCSRLVSEKNIQVIIDLYHFVEENDLPYNFTIIGNGYAMEKMTKEMPNAYFTGNIDQVQLAVYYNAADVFVFPSLSETFGNVMTEALSCGLPIVGARAGANQDIIQHGKDGYLVDPMDVQEYLFYVQKICFGGQRITYVQNALSNPFLKEWDDIYEQYCHYLKSLLVDEEVLNTAI